LAGRKFSEIYTFSDSGYLG